jgi:hypothetical protein
MAGYTRQDTADNIADTKTIDAADLDAEFDAVEAAFNNSTGHTHDGTTAEGAPIEVTGPNQEYLSEAAQFRPKTDDTYDLGSATFQWKDLYVDGTANIDSLVADTADIDGGTIDNTVIGGTTPAAGSFTNITVSGTVDGRDVAADGTKLDGIEAGADVTDTANVTAAGALMDSELTNITAVKALDQGVATTDSPTFAAITVIGNVDGRDVSVDGTKLDTIETNADVTDTANVTAAGALMDSELTNIAAVKALDQGVATTDSPTFAAITVTGNVDGRDVSVDGTKLDTIETNADVTDTANVTAAGALMDSELTNITAVKALDQGVATTDSPTFAAITASIDLSTSTLTGTTSEFNTALSDGSFATLAGTETLTNKTINAADNTLQAVGLGQCYLQYTNATTCTLIQKNGKLIQIEGELHVIPNAGVTLGTGGLSSSTLYYVYAYDNSGTLTLEASTTAWTVSTTAGNEGTPIKTGDNTRTLVGMAYANTSTQFSSDMVISYWNPVLRVRNFTETSELTTSSTSWVALGTAVYFLWFTGFPRPHAFASCPFVNSLVAGNTFGALYLNGTNRQVANAMQGSTEAAGHFPSGTTAPTQGRNYYQLWGVVGGGTGTYGIASSLFPTTQIEYWG